MPSLMCKCSKRISYGEIPCQDEWLLVSDVEFDRFTGQVDAEAIYGAATSLLKCPSCERLWVFWNGFQSPPFEYAKQVDDG
jgi:hypothetical protein